MNIDNILKKYRDEYEKKFEAYTFNCYFSIVFDNNQILSVKLKGMISCFSPTFIGQKLLTKNYSLKRYEDGYKYSFISKMKIEFTAYLSSMTFQDYLQQPKQMIEWSFMRKMKSNAIFLNVAMNIYNPIINEIREKIVWLPEEDDDE